ncbi:MAG TPA: hypothetical protein VJ860_13510 [Polyangia bacterium]|nr:hypothetical protein [Polyangia bacterium]
MTVWLLATLLALAVVLNFYRYAFQPFSKKSFLDSAVFKVPPAQKDASLLQGVLKPYRVIGYATDGDSARIVNARYFLAPVLLDLDYQRHDIVLSDYTTPTKDIFKTSPAYTLVAEFPQATDWARSTKIYRKVK